MPGRIAGRILDLRRTRAPDAEQGDEDMSARWQWRERDGVRFLAVDYRGTDDAQELALLLEISDILRGEPVGTPVLVYNDARLPTVEYARIAMEIGRTVFKPRQTRMAILGLPSAAVMGLRTFAAVTGGRRTAAFRDEEEAVGFLVQRAAREPAA